MAYIDCIPRLTTAGGGRSGVGNDGPANLPITVVDGHLSRAGKRWRGVGYGISRLALRMSNANAAQVARRLRTAGVNLVRHQTLDHNSEGVIGTFPSLDATQLDLYCYQWAQLKANGVYIALSPYYSQIDTSKRHVYLYYNLHITLQKAYLTSLLTHVNPYTGLALGADPALAIVEIINEVGALRAYFTNQFPNASVAEAAVLVSDWNTFLSAKYANDTAIQTAWGGTGAAGTNGEVLTAFTEILWNDGGTGPSDYKSRNLQVRKDWCEFLLQMEAAYITEIRDHIATLTDALITAGQVNYMGISSAGLCDVIDSHNYYDRPTVTTTWTQVNVPWVGAFSDLGYIGQLAGRAQSGKPMIVTETNYGGFNQYAAESAPAIFAVAALQDYDAVVFHNYNNGLDGSYDQLYVVGDLRNDKNPAKWLTFALAAQAFRRGDIAALSDVANGTYSAQGEIDTLAAMTTNQSDMRSLWNAAGSSHVYHPTNLFTERLYTTPDATTSSIGTAAALSSPITSATGEVIYDTTASQQSLQIKTQDYKAFAGYVNARTIDLGDGVEITPPTSADDDWYSFSMVRVRGTPLSRRGAVYRVTAFGKWRNTNMVFDTPDTVLSDWGETPVQVDVAPLVLRLPAQYQDVRVWAMDADGARGSAINPVNDGAGGCTVSLTGAAWFDLEFRARDRRLLRCDLASVGVVNTAPAGSPVITGTVTENQTLTADTSGISDADGLGAFSYQWYRDAVAISGATSSTYTLGDADAGTDITVRVNYTDGQGTAESLTSAAVGPVANINDAPTGSVTISGTATVGQTLTASNTLADADGLGTITYHWRSDADGYTSDLATGTTYVLQAGDEGDTIRATATYTDQQGTAESVNSNTLGPVIAANVPTITFTASDTTNTLTLFADSLSATNSPIEFWLTDSATLPTSGTGQSASYYLSGGTGYTLAAYEVAEAVYAHARNSAGFATPVSVSVTAQDTTAPIPAILTAMATSTSNIQIDEFQAPTDTSGSGIASRALQRSDDGSTGWATIATNPTYPYDDAQTVQKWYREVVTDNGSNTGTSNVVTDDPTQYGNEPAADYYVMNSGNDANDGLTTGTAWRTLPGTRNSGDTAYINTHTVPIGSIVEMERGLTLPSGAGRTEFNSTYWGTPTVDNQTTVRTALSGSGGIDLDYAGKTIPQFFSAWHNNRRSYLHIKGRANGKITLRNYSISNGYGIQYYGGAGGPVINGGSIAHTECLDGASTGGIGLGFCDDTVLDYVRAENHTNIGISLGLENDNTCNDVIVRNSAAGLNTAGSGGSTSVGIHVVGCNRSVIDGCHAYGNRRDGIDKGSASNGTVNSALVLRSYSYDNGEDGFAGNGSTIASGAGLSPYYYIDCISFRNGFAGGGSITGGFTAYEGADSYVYYCLASRCSRSFNLWAIGGYETYMRVRNAISHRPTSRGIYVEYDPNGATFVIDVDYSLFMPASADTETLGGGANYSGTPGGTHIVWGSNNLKGIAQNPNFTAEHATVFASNDFHIPIGSPADGAGVVIPLSSFPTWVQDYLTSIGWTSGLKDLDDVAFANPPAIGVYEAA